MKTTDYMLGDDSHPLSEWGEMFGAGKDPVADARRAVGRKPLMG